MKPIPLNTLLVMLTFANGLAAVATELGLDLPLGRTAYQDNEWIDVSVARLAPGGLPAGELSLGLEGADGSRLQFIFPVDKVEGASGVARAVEHVRVNGWLLRPGSYEVEVACDGAAARTNIEVFSHVRRSTFRLINWGRAQGEQQLAQGEDNLGFNLFYGQSAHDDGANLIRAGVDFMGCCVMGGGHQMDLRQECDWSDPYVIRGGTRRATQRAFIDRTRPNVLGVHFYDEPGLTWVADPGTGQPTPHAVPWQLRQYEAAFGKARMNWREVDAANPAHVDAWSQWSLWKLGLMDAAWKDAQFGVSRVRPDCVPVTQSQYGYGAFADGYYFTVARSLPVVSGHGGYHDFGPGYFNPSLFLEFARARDVARPNWYLPTWYASTTADQFRLEQYLSFQCNLQGLISPPDLEPADPAKNPATQGIVEVNQLAARLGAVFGTMPVTRPSVALLFSLSQFLHAQTLDRGVNYAHETPHGRNLMFAYLAGKLLQHQFMPLLEEEVLDGTLSGHHRAVILASLDYLKPSVVTALEAFARQGRLVILTADSTVNVSGAVKLGAAPGWPDAEQIARLRSAGKADEVAKLTTLRHALAGARQLAEAIRPQLQRAGINPPMMSSEPGIVVTRQAAGDIEYLFAVNATHDPRRDPMLGMTTVSTTLTLAEDQRAVYDAVLGQVATAFVKVNGRLQGDFRFGPGQMRVFARTQRPIGRVTVGAPVLRRDFTRQDAPVSLSIAATILDDHGDMLSGSFPLRVRVTDALGGTRYDLYRATAEGVLRLVLPLAVNDPTGPWRVTVIEMLSGKRGAAVFTLPATRTCSAAAGAARRALHWPEDRGHIFRFFREHPSVTVVTGASPFHAAAAERLSGIVRPWNVQCATIGVAEANRPRHLSADEAATWIGLKYAGRGAIQAGDQNLVVQAGIAVAGPVILLGTPEDNPLIKHLADLRFLPYPPNATNLPGPGRGYVAWQRDGLGPGQESVTLIAYDAAGMNEAVGSMYDFLAGLEPLLPYTPPARSELSPATTTHCPRETKVLWTVTLPDRVDALRANGGRIAALSHDGSLSELSPDGNIHSTRVVEAANLEETLRELRSSPDPALLDRVQRQLPPTRLAKLAAVRDNRVAVGCWGGRLYVFDAQRLVAEHRGPQDFTVLAWAGDHLVAGDADGRVVAFQVDAE